MKRLLSVLFIGVVFVFSLWVGGIEKTSAQYSIACGSACTYSYECNTAPAGCNACSGGRCGGNPPPSCGSPCSTPSDCEGAYGCNLCTGGVCSQPPVVYPPSCGQTCTADSQCEISDDLGGGGCRFCEKAAGAGAVAQGVCSNKPPIACGNACTKDADCNSGNALRDGCIQCKDNKCQKPPSCGNACNSNLDCAAAKDGCVLCGDDNKCKAPPSCSSACTKDADCNSGNALRDGCIQCKDNKCQKPPACSSACTKDTDCATGPALKDGCIACKDNKCQKPPSCGSACIKDADCNSADALKMGCVSCIGNQCQKPPTPTPVPPRPKCDTIEYTFLKTGENATITAHAKVAGENAQGTKITTQSFFLTEGAEDDSGQIIIQSGPITAVKVSTSPTLDKYTSVWTFKFPKLVSGHTYRLWSTIAYTQGSASNFSSPTVAGASTSEISLFGKLTAFVKGIFGISTNSNFVVVSPTPIKIAVGPKGAKVLSASSAQQSLQLGQVTPIEVYQKTCNMIKFRYNF